MEMGKEALLLMLRTDPPPLTYKCTHSATLLDSLVCSFYQTEIMSTNNGLELVLDCNKSFLIYFFTYFYLL